MILDIITFHSTVKMAEWKPVTSSLIFSFYIFHSITHEIINSEKNDSRYTKNLEVASHGSKIQDLFR